MKGWKAIFPVLLGITLFGPLLLHTYLGIGFSPILSGSMRPTFNPGDILITKQTRAGVVQVGNVVVLRHTSDGAEYSHRVIKVNRTSNASAFTTKGDANPTIDEEVVTVNNSVQLRRMVGHIPWLGYPIVWFNSPSGRRSYLYLVVGLGCLGLVRWVWRLVNENPGNKET